VLDDLADYNSALLKRKYRNHQLKGRWSKYEELHDQEDDTCPDQDQPATDLLLLAHPGLKVQNLGPYEDPQPLILLVGANPA